MRAITYKYHFTLFIFFSACNFFTIAQTVSIQTDRNQILIGERIQYDLQITLPGPGYSINFILPDSITHFEVIEKGVFDTTGSGNALSLHRKIIFTSWDSGAWYIPSFPVTLEVNNSFKRFITDSVLINVGYAPADSTNELRDIKPIMEVSESNDLWIYILAAVLTGLVLMFLLYRYFKNRRPKPVQAFHSPFSPYHEAMNELKLLSKYDLHLPAETKEYHVHLSTILKRYYSRTVNDNFLNKTTGDLLMKLKEKNLETTLISIIAGSLRIADAVKFARYMPPASESELCLINVKQAIEKLERIK